MARLSQDSSSGTWRRSHMAAFAIARCARMRPRRLMHAAAWWCAADVSGPRVGRRAPVRTASIGPESRTRMRRAPLANPGTRPPVLSHPRGAAQPAAAPRSIPAPAVRPGKPPPESLVAIAEAKARPFAPSERPSRRSKTRVASAVWSNASPPRTSWRTGVTAIATSPPCSSHPWSGGCWTERAGAANALAVSRGRASRQHPGPIG
jgi:hypothetical protein